jgi:hypothetical protein
VAGWCFNRAGALLVDISSSIRSHLPNPQIGRLYRGSSEHFNGRPSSITCPELPDHHLQVFEAPLADLNRLPQTCLLIFRKRPNVMIADTFSVKDNSEGHYHGA